MKSFYKKFFFLMIPMALKELISSLVNLVDTIMVGRLGETPIAAVGIGNQVYFLYTVFLFGISCGAGVFSSQFWGVQNKKGMRQVLSINLILGTILSLLFVGAAHFFPAQIYQMFKATPEVMQEGITYLKIVSIGYIATAITTAFDNSVCCSEKAGLPFLVRFVGLTVNIVLNWVLIFGKLGAPVLGVKGAAIATVIARFSELLVICIAIYGGKMIQAIHLSELFAIPKELFVKFCKTSIPVILNEMAWALGTTTYAWIYARISPDAMVIITIVQNIERLMMVFFHGGGNAAGVFIGKAVGGKKYQQAYVYAKKLSGLMIGTATLLCGIFILCRPLMLLPYQVSAEVHDQAMLLLMIVSIMMIIKSITFLFIVGVFRNGGDTRAACLIDIGTVWLVGVPMVAISGLIFHFPLPVCYALMGTDEIVKFCIAIHRFRSKKWIKNVIADA